MLGRVWLSLHGCASFLVCWGMGFSRKPTLRPPLLPVCVCTPSRGPWACWRKSRTAVQSLYPTALLQPSPATRQGLAGLLRRGTGAESEPTLVFNVGTWKPLWDLSGSRPTLLDRLGIPGRNRTAPPCGAHARPGSSQRQRGYGSGPLLATLSV